MLKNVLYLDENYKNDCEVKIDYTIAEPANTSNSSKDSTYFTKKIKSDKYKLINKGRPSNN